jgi:hypothetical protein
VGETILGTVMQKSYLIHEKQDKYVCLWHSFSMLLTLKQWDGKWLSQSK